MAKNGETGSFWDTQYPEMREIRLLVVTTDRLPKELCALAIRNGDWNAVLLSSTLSQEQRTAVIFRAAARLTESHGRAWVLVPRHRGELDNRACRMVLAITGYALVREVSDIVVRFLL